MRRLRIGVVVAVLVVGLSAAGLIWRRADHTAQDRAERTADALAETTRSSAATTIAGLGGAAGMVPDVGSVPLDSLDAFRRDVARVSSLTDLATVEIVPGEERSAFETKVGRSITELVGDGLQVAPARDSYWAVRAVSPADSVAGALIGVDVAASDISAAAAAAARDSGDTVMTETLAIAADDALFFFIKPLYRPGLPLDTVEQRRAAHVGFIASAALGQSLGEAIAADAPDRVAFEIRDGSILLARSDPPPTGDTIERQVEIAGRTWTLDIRDGRAPDHDLAWFIAMVTVLLAVGLAWAFRRTTLHERSMMRVARLVASAAEFGRHVAGAASVAEVGDVVRERLPSDFGARSALLRSVAPGDPPPGDADVRVRVLADGSARHALVPVEGAGSAVAVLDLELEPRTRVDEPMLATLRTVAELCEQSLRRAGLTDAIAERAEQLEQLAAALAGTVSVAEVADVMTDLGRTPVGAAVASLGLIDEASQVLRVHHGADVAEQIRTEYANPPLAQRLAFTDAARTGEAVLVADGDEYRRRYPDATPGGNPLGDGGRAAVPLRDGDRVIGALIFAWAEACDFDDAQVSTLATIAEMATQSVLRARLLQDQISDAQRSRDLADFARDVARTRTEDGLVDAVLRAGALPIGATISNIGLIDRERRRLVVRPHPGAPPDVVEDLGERSLDDDDLPGLAAIRANEPVVLVSPDEIAEAFPGRYADAAATMGVVATVHVPLVGADGSALGVIGFGWTDHEAITLATMATARTLGQLCAQTLERVRLGEAEHHLVSNLQHRVVLPLPTHPALSLAQRYRPAADVVGMGGDWYEGVVLDDGRYLVVVGDIAGHGINAVAEMIQVRSVITGLVRSGTDLGQVLSIATGLLGSSGDVVTASVAVFVLDPAQSELAYVMAGHPPPVLIDPDGSVRTLDDGRQPLLGLPIAEVEPGRAPFGVGATLVAYTDGLVERRTETIDESLDRLVAIAADRRAAGTEGFADELVERCLDGAAPGDDVALVVVAHV